MKKVKRGISRFFLLIFGIVIMPVELVFPRLYMIFYIKVLRLLGLKMNGTPRYISSKAVFDDFDLIEIGDRVVISKNVMLLTHDYSITTALVAIGVPPVSDIQIKRPISIGRNVFIGLGSIIMPGAVIGDNVIVGAGSVVRGKVRSDTIVYGNPASEIGEITKNPQHWINLSRGAEASQD